MNKALVRAALVASTLAAVLLPTSPATAATLAITDSTDDVWRTGFDFETGEETGPEPAGSPVNADLARTVAKHTTGKLVLKARYVDLAKRTHRFAFAVQLRTNEGLKREIGVETFTREGWGGTAYFGSPQRELRCQGMTHGIDYVTDTVTVAVPRACLSKPRWVQVRVMAVAFDESTPDQFVAYQDNGHDQSADEPTAWSGRVRRA